MVIEAQSWRLEIEKSLKFKVLIECPLDGDICSYLQLCSPQAIGTA